MSERINNNIMNIVSSNEAFRLTRLFDSCKPSLNYSDFHDLIDYQSKEVKTLNTEKFVKLSTVLLGTTGPFSLPNFKVHLIEAGYDSIDDCYFDCGVLKYSIYYPLTKEETIKIINALYPRFQTVASIGGIFCPTIVARQSADKEPEDTLTYISVYMPLINFSNNRKFDKNSDNYSTIKRYGVKLIVDILSSGYYKINMDNDLLYKIFEKHFADDAKYGRKVTRRQSTVRARINKEIAEKGYIDMDNYYY